MTITADGLRIELIETEAGMFFESGVFAHGIRSELFGAAGRGTEQNCPTTADEGHTDAKPS